MYCVTGRLAFVNCTRDPLINGLVPLLPSTSTIVEILETVPSDSDVMAAGHALKEQRYPIALDDYVAGDRRAPLAEMADIIKVDWQLTTQEERDQTDQAVRAMALPDAGGKVETQSQFAQAQPWARELSMEMNVSIG